MNDLPEVKYKDKYKYNAPEGEWLESNKIQIQIKDNATENEFLKWNTNTNINKMRPRMSACFK